MKYLKKYSISIVIIKIKFQIALKLILYTSEGLRSVRQVIANAIRDIDCGAHSTTAYETTKMYSKYGNNCVGSSEREECINLKV